jgi:very-short-patch-repair endonuclease
MQMPKMPEYRVKLVRGLRKRQTESEQYLWSFLRAGKLEGCKFRRQRPLDRYIADFCCDALKLVIEIDGTIHDGIDQQEYDAVRNNLMAAHGFTVVRISASEIVTQTETALERIRQAIAACRSKVGYSLPEAIDRDAGA